MQIIGTHSIGTAVLLFWPSQPNWWDDRDAEVNGDLRDRPDRKFFPPLPKYDMDADFARSYARAKSCGFNAIFLDLLSGSEHVTRAQSAMRGAAAAGISVIPQPDTNSWQGSIRGAAFANDAAINAEAARRIVAVAKTAPALYDDNGAFILSPYNADLAQVTNSDGSISPAWNAARWKDIIARTEALLGTQVVFYPIFQSMTKAAAYKTALGAKFVAVGLWGTATYTMAGASQTAAAKTAQDLGLEYIAYVRHQDIRPRESKFDESLGTATLRNSWSAALSTGAKHVIVPTWDDQFEGAHLWPSENRGTAWGPLTRYHVRQFQLGRAPVVIKDVVFLCHRQTPWQARPSQQTEALMQPRYANTAKDITEVLLFLIDPADVTFDGGAAKSYPKGLTVLNLPWSLGTHTVVVKRNGAEVARVSSLLPVQSSLPRQELDYGLAASVADDDTWFVDQTTTPDQQALLDRWKKIQTALGLVADGIPGNLTAGGVEALIDQVDELHQEIANMVAVRDQARADLSLVMTRLEG